LPAGKCLLRAPLRIPSHSGIHGVGTLSMVPDRPVLICEGKDAESQDGCVQGITIEKKWRSQSEQQAIIVRNAVNVRLARLNTFVGNSIRNGSLAGFSYIFGVSEQDHKAVSNVMAE
jgi:hypothetical protein